MKVKVEVEVEVAGSTRYLRSRSRLWRLQQTIQKYDIRGTGGGCEGVLTLTEILRLHSGDWMRPDQRRWRLKMVQNRLTFQWDVVSFSW